MKFIDTIKTANSNLFRSKVRTLLTLLAVFVGTFTLTLTTAAGEGIKDYINKQTESFSPKGFLIIYPKDLFGGGDGGLTAGEPTEYTTEDKQQIPQKLFLTPKDLDSLEALDGLTEAIPQYMTSPEYIALEGGKKYTSNATDIYFEGLEMALSAGKLPDEKDPSALLLSYRFLKPFGFNTPQEAVGKKVSMGFKDGNGTERVESFTVSGVLINSLVSQNNLINFNKAQEIYAFQNGTADTFSFVFGKLEKDISGEKLTALKKTLSEKDLEAQTFEDSIKSFNKAISIAQMSLGFFSALVLIAASLGIINTLYMSVYERTREIGLLKSLGMRRKSIFAIFAYEAISIGFWGAIIGIISAIGAGTLINNILSNGPLKGLEGFNLMTYPLPVLGMIVLGTMLVGFISGALPALKAAKLNPIDALRQE